MKVFYSFLKKSLLKVITYNQHLEWEFVQGLAYTAHTPEDAEFVQLIYTTRLRKFKHVAEHALTRKRLVDEYNLGDNPDVMYSFADSLYSSFRWADCYKLTERYVNRYLLCLWVHNFAKYQDPRPHIYS